MTIEIYEKPNGTFDILINLKNSDVSPPLFRVSAEEVEVYTQDNPPHRFVRLSKLIKEAQ